MGDEGSGKGQSLVHFARRAGSSFSRPLEPTPKTSEPGLVGPMRGWTSGIKPGLSPPSETNGAAGKEQKDERSKGGPKRRSGVGHKVRVVQFPHFMLDERKQSDVNGERDKGDEGGEERCNGGKQGNCDVSREREE